MWFKGRQFTAEVILWAVRWYLMFPISYRDLELMLADRGVEVAHTTLFRWIQAYAPELEKRIRPHLRRSDGSWRVDETYVRVKGRWKYLYRGRSAPPPAARPGPPDRRSRPRGRGHQSWAPTTAARTGRGGARRVRRSSRSSSEQRRSVERPPTTPAGERPEAVKPGGRRLLHQRLDVKSFVSRWATRAVSCCGPATSRAVAATDQPPSRSPLARPLNAGDGLKPHPPPSAIVASSAAGPLVLVFPLGKGVRFRPLGTLGGRDFSASHRLIKEELLSSRRMPCCRGAGRRAGGAA